MNVRKNNEEGLFVENENSQMFFGKNGVDCYVLSIYPNENNERVFTISNRTLDFEEKKIFEIFEEFISSMFGNTVIL